jgi:hypothetical protein
MQIQFQGHVIQYKANSLVVGVVGGTERKTTTLLKYKNDRANLV